MLILRQIYRFFATLVLATVIGLAKLTTAVLMVIALIIESFGWLFQGTKFSSVVLKAISLKVCNLTLDCEDLQVLLLQRHMEANVKLIMTIEKKKNPHFGEATSTRLYEIDPKDYKPVPPEEVN